MRPSYLVAVGGRAAVARLEDDGVVRGYRADIDPRQLGYTLTAVTRIRPAPGQLRVVAELAQQTPEIAECLRITGDDCYIATTHHRDVGHSQTSQETSIASTRLPAFDAGPVSEDHGSNTDQISRDSSGPSAVPQQISDRYKVGSEQLFYVVRRGMSENEAAATIVNGCMERTVKELSMEYAVEMNRLIQLQMEGAVG